jgi:hypothetical protein
MLATGEGEVVMGGMIQHLSEWTLIRRGLGLSILLLALGRAGAIERTLEIVVPASVAAGQELNVTISASTNAGQGEQVGFLQAETSLDGGKTWAALCYLQKSGVQVVQHASLKPGPAGTTVQLRVRVAFREGLAGDVDYNGAAIIWKGSWENWQSPPAQHASVTVTAR